MTPRFNRLLIAALVTLVSSAALAEPITGQASVIDGDTLEIHGQRIRLWAHGYPKQAAAELEIAARNVERDTGSIPPWLTSRIDIATAEAAKQKR